MLEMIIFAVFFVIFLNRFKIKETVINKYVKEIIFECKLYSLLCARLLYQVNTKNYQGKKLL